MPVHKQTPLTLSFNDKIVTLQYMLCKFREHIVYYVNVSYTLSKRIIYFSPN